MDEGELYAGSKKAVGEEGGMTMSRTIKYRGRQGLTNWHYGSLVQKSYIDSDDELRTTSYIIDDLPINRTTYGRVFKSEVVDSATVGEFTGLTDKYNREIYEGDIVECVSWNEYFTSPSTGEVLQPFRRRMYVDFRNGAFKMIEPMPEPLKDNVWDIIYNGDIEVIGNIYDNLDLINIKKR